jgi:miniconductance mechanosensitive channel
MNTFLNGISQWMQGLGASSGCAMATAIGIYALSVVLAGLLLCAASSYFSRRFLTTKSESVSLKEKKDKFIRVLSFFIFSWFISFHLPDAFDAYPAVKDAISRILNIATVILCAAMLSTASTYLRSTAKSRLKNEAFASKTFSQTIKLLIWFTAAVIVAAIIMKKSPAFVLSGLGALTAVLMLIFRDSILGLVAGIQVSQNDMVRVGDWITMPSFNADGNVIDIALTTVKVQNFDNTVTMIPSSALISSSFINWRYMSTSKGRRIKRPVWISATSVCELTDEFREKLIDQGLLKKDDRPVSNLAAFEIWLRRMLSSNENITKELTCMVRQTEAADTGIPVEVYAFTKTRDWIEYEMIQTDIFDRIFVTVPKFNLLVYQRTGDKTITL